jgi:hypothetical protein
MRFYLPSGSATREAAAGRIGRSSLKLSPAALCVAFVCAIALFAASAQGASALTVNGAIQKLQANNSIDPIKAAAARKAYSDARSVRKRVSGERRTAMTFQIRVVESMARQNRITYDRVTPLFDTLQNNADWFKANGPATAGTDRRFDATDRIIFQYFAGMGWMWHPLSNFAKLNAVWTVKSPAARRSLPTFAQELIQWSVNRGGAMTWEYYFPFGGSKAPFISSISQGTAIQSLARVGDVTKDASITAAATAGAKAFGISAPVGLKIVRDEGFHYIGYSGNRHTIILNMFLQALDGLHDYSIYTNDQAAWDLYREGLKAARRETVLSDTGAWSLYSLGGPESPLSYHQLVTGFLTKLCTETTEPVFCTTRDNFQNDEKTKPVISQVKKTVKGKRIYVTFKLSKISTVKLSSSAGTTTSTVGYGRRSFSVAKGSSKAITLTATDLAGNSASLKK